MLASKQLVVQNKSQAITTLFLKFVYAAGDDPDSEGHGDHRVRAPRHQPDVGVHLQYVSCSVKLPTLVRQYFA